TTRIEQRLLHLGRVGEAVHHDIERPVPEVLAQPRRHPLHAEVPHIAVALVVAHLGGRVGEGVERRVQRIDTLELELACSPPSLARWRPPPRGGACWPAPRGAGWGGS